MDLLNNKFFANRKDDFWSFLLLALLTMLMAGNVSAQITIDSFEDSDISEYSGDKGGFSVGQNTVYDGSYSLETSQHNVDVIASDNDLLASYSQGDSVQFFFYKTDEGNDDRPYFCIHASGLGANDGVPDNGYCLELMNSPARDSSKENRFNLKERNGGTTVNTWNTNHDWKTGTWYIGNITYSNDGTLDAEVYEGGTTDKVASIYGKTPSEDFSNYDGIFWGSAGGRASFVGTWYYDFANKNGFNSAPVFDSVSFSPSSWTLEGNIGVSVNVSDDGGVDSVNASVWENESRIRNDVSLSQDVDGNWTRSDLFSVDESDVWYNVSIKATDDSGASKIKWINRSVVGSELSWSDESDSEDGFRIYSNVSGGDFVEVGSVDAGETSFSYGTSVLSFDESRCFQVTAYNQYGESSPAENCLKP